MNVEVEALNPCQKKLTVQLSAEEVDQEYQAVLRDIRKDVTLPGFRKGKASISTIRRRFAREIKNQVKENLLERSLKEALVQEDIAPIGTPTLDIKKISFPEHTASSYEVEVEFLPPLDIAEYTGIEIPKPSVPEVPEEAIQQTLENLQRQNALNEPVDEGHRIQENDSVTINYAQTVNGEAFAEPVKNYSVWLGVDPVIPELHDHLLGRTKGDQITFPVTYGDDAQNAELVGKTVDFTVDIVDIEKVVLPELDDEFAKDLEEESLDDLRTKIEAELKARLERDTIQATKQAVLMKLADTYVFDIPPSLLAEHKKNHPDRNEDELQRMIRAGIILSKIEARENISVTPEEIDARVEQLAMNNNVPAQTMRNFLAQQGGLDRLQSDLLETKTLDFLYEHANFTEEK